MTEQDTPRQNHLLALLPPESYAQVAAHLEKITADLRQIMYEQEEPIHEVYFPITGVYSLVVMFGSEEQAVEVATIGNEGMIGMPVFLGSDRMNGRCFSQVPGEAWKMPVAAFKQQIQQNQPFNDVLQLYLQGFLEQITQTAACNRFHSVDQRFARWMLMTGDRAQSNQFPITQEFLGQMLGVRRQTVNETATYFQEQGMVSYARGMMTILDRQGMEQASCVCYEIIRRTYERLLGIQHG